MKIGARVSGMTDRAVVELARRIRRKREMISPFHASLVPMKSKRGLMQRFGLGKYDSTVGPEFTLAKMLKCWKELKLFTVGNSYGRMDDEERHAKEFELLNTRIQGTEYRVFGTNHLPPDYPKFNSLIDWLAWRLPRAHPEYRCDPEAGWTRELYEYAIEDANLAFP